LAYAIIPQHLSIDAMRSSGYRDSAYAVAELIDNSIQAGESLDRPVNVEVICVDRSGSGGGSRRRMDKIAVYDNASGMDSQTLRRALQFGVGNHRAPSNQDGIGKFGMGLPNSSISQCRRVDVWSWKDGITHHTYLDIDEIEAQTMLEVPEPQVSAVPQEWLKLVAVEPADSGTLVVWSTLDRVQWKQSTALLRNAEFIIGRVYRYFVNDGRATIRLAAYEMSAGQAINHIDHHVRPNDPMFLMRNTSAPHPYDTDPAFEPFGEPEEIDVGFGGGSHKVMIAASISKVETRKVGGNSAIGQHAKKNLGISVVRADRELEMNHTFDNSYDPRERWWGIEVSFPPALDDLFGVTNNKQAATSFQRMILADDAEAEEMSVADYREMLEQDRDPRLVMYQISSTIERLLTTMRTQVNRMRENTIREKTPTGDDGTAESIATRALRRRQEKLGQTGASDADEKRSEEDRTEELTGEIEQEGVDHDKAREIAVDWVSRKLKFMFRHADVPGSAVFDVTSKAGVIIVTINTRHPAHEHLFELLREGEENAPESPALKGLKLLLTAWARMEDEATGDRKTELEDTRGEWGRIARDFIREADD